VSEFKFKEVILPAISSDLPILPASFFTSNAAVARNQLNQHRAQAKSVRVMLTGLRFFRVAHQAELRLFGFGVGPIHLFRCRS
jgi:hypothetical protein